MNIATRKLILPALASASLLGSIGVPMFDAVAPASAASSAAKSCQCVDYVNAILQERGMPKVGGNARDFGRGLTDSKHRFKAYSTPKAGDIAVFPGGVGGSPSAGHVGVVVGYSESGGKIRLSIRGANQYVGGTPYTDKGCSNVRVTNYAPIGKGKVTFYRK